MPNPDNLPQLPKNQSPIIDDQTGIVSRDWYRFFLNLLNKANSAGGNGTVTSVDVSGGTTGLTTSGGPITTAGTITLAGTVAVANGGTGAITAAGARTNLDVPSTTGSGASGTWGINVTGNAGTVTNGVYTTGSYADPTWITSLAGSKVTGNISGQAGSVANSLTAGTGISYSVGTTYNGSVAVTVNNSAPMVYPGVGIPNSTGTAWGASYTTTGSGTTLVLATSPSLVTPILGTPTSGNFSTGTFTWPTFNQNTTGSAATLTTGRTISISGDLTYTSSSFNGSANVTAAGTLATVNATVGSFTNASITVNGKGLVTAASSGTAPVTSVTGTSPVVSSGGATPAISLASGYGDTQNPYASKTANFFLAAPNGIAGVPTFRAVVAADIPTLNQNTTGTAANITASSNTTLTSLANLNTVGTITSGTWSGLFGAVSGANLTSLTAGNLTGTIPSTVLGNSSLNIGTTSVALNRASANLALTGISNITFPGATSGSVQIIPTAVAGTGTVITMPATTGTMALTSDIPTVNNGTLTLATSGTGLSGSASFTANQAGASTFTVTSNATNANTASTIVARDASGNFSAGIITAALSGNATTATSATSATTSTNIANGALGSLPYQSAASTTALLAGNTTTTKQFLVQTGTGTVSAAPAWGSIVAADVPTLNQNTTGTASNVTGTVAIANGGTGQTTAVNAFDALSPATVKGDLIVSNGTDNVRQAVGTDTFVLTADSTTATGVKWAATSGAGLTISNDTATATNVYPTFAAATSGTMSTIYTGNAKLLYKPSTGELTSTHLVASNGIFLNSLTIGTSYTIPSGYSGVSAGVITVSNGITVTVSSGSRWVVV